MGRRRIRAHANVMSDFESFDPPISPDHMDWATHYPRFFTKDAEGKVVGDKKVTIADVGCGFGGLSVTLSDMFPDKLTLGLEIRNTVVDLVHTRILKAREEGKKEDGSVGPYDNVSVLRTNFMKYAANYFHKGQIEKMFFLFPDPHFKQGNHRRRIINRNFLAIYAYLIKEGGLLYTITDVKDLHEWMVQHLDDHPCFERLSDEEQNADPLVATIAACSEEGKKVTRLKGSKFPAVYRRIAPKAQAASGDSEPPAKKAKT